MWDGVLCEVIPPPPLHSGHQWRPQPSPSDLASVASQCQAVLRPGWGQPGPGSLGPVKTESCDNNEITFVTLSRSAKQSSSECERLRNGCHHSLREWTEDDDETGLCLAIDLSGPCPGSAHRETKQTLLAANSLRTYYSWLCIPMWRSISTLFWMPTKLLCLAPRMNECLVRLSFPECIGQCTVAWLATPACHTGNARTGRDGAQLLPGKWDKLVPQPNIAILQRWK